MEVCYCVYCCVGGIKLVGYVNVYYFFIFLERKVSRFGKVIKVVMFEDNIERKIWNFFVVDWFRLDEKGELSFVY